MPTCKCTHAIYVCNLCPRSHMHMICLSHYQFVLQVNGSTSVEMSVICILFTFFPFKTNKPSVACLLAVKICKVRCWALWGVLKCVGIELWTFILLTFYLNWNAACKVVDGPHSFLCSCSGPAQKSHPTATNCGSKHTELLVRFEQDQFVL